VQAVVKNIAPQNVAELLAKCLLFRVLDDATRQDLAKRVRHQSFKAGEPIFSVGAPGQSMMVIVNGTVRISLPGPRGRGVIIADLAPGEVLGEVALLDGKQRSADATAQTNCDLLVLDRRDALSVLERRSDICLKLLELLCARLRRSDAHMTDIAFYELPARLAKVILEQIGASERTGAKSRLSLSQTELASMINGTRESVNRCLRLWQRQAIVDLDEGWIVVLQRDALSALAEHA
jgi:CRP/FNR family cyclic AMP-dependent transcriptional regulator